MTMYFGERWDAPLFDAGTIRQARMPLGQPCWYCGEEIVEGDSGFMVPTTIKGVIAGRHPVALPVHKECQLRSVIGGLDHVEGRCQHVGHCNELREAAGRSLREDALATWDWVQQHGVPNG